MNIFWRVTLFISVLLITIACDTNQVCETYDNAADIPFIDNAIEELESSDIEGESSITWYEYQEKDIFTVNFPDEHFVVYDCEGKILCESGESCIEIFENAQIKDIIWKKER